MTNQVQAVDPQVRREQAGLLMLHLQHLRGCWDVASLPKAWEHQLPHPNEVRNQLTVALWEILEPEICKVTWRWRGPSSFVPRSVVADDAAQSMALNGFTDFVTNLDKLTIDLDLNPIGFACKIISWNLFREHRREESAITGLSLAQLTRKPKGKGKGEDNDQDPPPPRLVSLTKSNLEEVVPDNKLTEDMVITRTLLGDAREAMHSIIEGLSDPKDGEILRMAVEGLNSKEIAARLGPGWKDTTVRQRLSRRIWPDFKAELRRRGLLGEET